MLFLEDAPCFVGPDGRRRSIPVTVPGGLLVFLAVEARWIERELLARRFWPELEAAEALHNVRANLLRLKALLRAQGWPAGALEPERGRVRLRLPTEAADLGAALNGHDVVALLAHRPYRWLGTFTVASPAFASWAENLRITWMHRWARRLCRHLAQALHRGDAAEAEKLFLALNQNDDSQQRLDVQAVLQAVDPRSLQAVGLAAWLHMRARLEHPQPGGDDRGPAPLSVPPAPESARLVGRQHERELLARWSGPVAIVSGEPGIGKSALLLHAFPGALPLRAREGLQGLPYLPLLEALRRRLPGLTASAANPASRLHAYRLDLARVLPELAPDLPLPPLDMTTAKARLVEALARAFEDDRLLLVDDLQWCDEPTLEFLLHVALEGRVRWVASARAYELSPAAQRVLGALEETHLLLRVPLGPLRADETAELCRLDWPDLAWPEARVHSLQRRSAGNPFAIRQWVSFSREQARDWEASPEGHVPPSVRDIVLRRLASLPPMARRCVQTLAIVGTPLTVAELAALLQPSPGIDELLQAIDEAQNIGLLRDGRAGRFECAHDLVREITAGALSAPRRQALHRRVAQWLAQQGGPADAQRIALQWELAGDAQAALAWLHKAAEHARSLGRFDMARQLWQRVDHEASDLCLRLRARLGLGQCHLLDDLPAGRHLLEDVLEAIGVVADESTRLQIEGRSLSCLVDNTVYAGDLIAARLQADRLRQLLPRLALDDRLHALEVLVELTMRESDLPAAAAYVRQRQLLAPNDAITLSLHAQVQWLQGNVRAARDGFEQLLQTHAAYASGQTLENDLAVMLYALGELPRAEEMLHRSLRSWEGVVHAQTLSSLVLGSVLTSAGR